MSADKSPQESKSMFQYIDVRIAGASWSNAWSHVWPSTAPAAVRPNNATGATTQPNQGRSNG